MMFLLPKSEATREVAVWLFVLLTFVVGVSIIFGRYEDAETHAPIVAISVFYVVAHVGLAIAVPTADTPTTRAFLFLYFVFNVAGGTQGALQETSNETLSPLNQQLRAIPHVANAGVFAVSLLFCLMRPSVEAWAVLRGATVLVQLAMAGVGAAALWLATPGAPLTFHPGCCTPPSLFVIWPLAWFGVIAFLSPDTRMRLSRRFWPARNFDVAQPTATTTDEEAFRTERWAQSFPRTLALMTLVNLLAALDTARGLPLGEAEWGFYLARQMFLLSMLLLRVWVHRWSDAKLARVWFGRAWIVAHLARYLFALLLLRLGPAQGAGWAPSHAHVAYLAGTFIWVWQMHTLAIPMSHQTILVMGRCVEMSIHHPLSWHAGGELSPTMGTVYTRVAFVTATLAGFAVGAWLESQDRREHVASTRFSPKPTARLNLQPALPPMHALTLRFIDADLEARFLEQLETSHLGLAVLVMLLLAATATSPAAVHLTVGIAVQLGLRVVGSPAMPFGVQMVAMCAILPIVVAGEHARQTAFSSLSIVFMCLFFASSPSLTFLSLGKYTSFRFEHHASYMVVGILSCLAIGFVIDRTYLYFGSSLL